MMFRLNKKIILLVFIFVMSVVIYLLVNRFLVFNVLSVSPDPLPSSATTITITLNKDIDQKKYNEKKNLSINTDKEYLVKLKRNTINIYLSDGIDKGEKITITLKDLSSLSGQKINKTIQLTSRYIKANELSKEEQKIGLERSDSFEKEYPLIKKLPLSSSVYEVGYNFPSSNDNKMPLLVTAKTKLPYPTDIQGNSIINQTQDPFVAAYINEVRLSRETAISDLKRLGYSDEKYKIYFTEDVDTPGVDGVYIGDTQ